MRDQAITVYTQVSELYIFLVMKNMKDNGGGNLINCINDNQWYVLCISVNNYTVLVFYNMMFIFLSLETKKTCFSNEGSRIMNIEFMKAEKS